MAYDRYGYDERGDRPAYGAPEGRAGRSERPAAASGGRSARTHRPAAAAPGTPGQVRPAHPLPEHRTGTLDYDRYLERSTSKFKIFSAAEQRRRKRAVAIGAAVAAVVVIIVVWAILSQTPAA